MPSGDLNSKQDVLEAIGASSIQRWEGLDGVTTGLWFIYRMTIPLLLNLTA